MQSYIVLNFARAGDPAPRLVVLDPGHGGSDLGATVNHLAEKDLNLDIAWRAERLFRSRGYDVYMTRRNDVDTDLFDRADAANILGADVFVSIHNNSVSEARLKAGGIAGGSMALFNSAAAVPARDLAEKVCQELKTGLGTPSCALEDRPRLVVLNSTWVPAVLVEVSMLPNARDAKMISERLYRERAAEAIVAAVDKYLGGPGAARAGGGK